MDPLVSVFVLLLGIISVLAVFAVLALLADKLFPLAEFVESNTKAGYLRDHIRRMR